MTDRPYLLTKVIHYQGDTAYAKVRYAGKWVPVELVRSSLVSLDLREDDSFEWIPQEDGFVRLEHIRAHPRRSDPEEIERTEQAFDALAKLMIK